MLDSLHQSGGVVEGDKSRDAHIVQPSIFLPQMAQIYQIETAVLGVDGGMPICGLREVPVEWERPFVAAYLLIVRLTCLTQY